MAAAEKTIEHNFRQKIVISNLPFQGLVFYLVPERNFGTIVTADGLEIYFLRSSVIGNVFDKLEPGDRVRFNLIHGVLGLQARQVMAASNESLCH